MLAEVALVVMPIRVALGLVERFNLELGFRFVDQLGRDVLDETVGNVVDEREIPVLAALDSGDDVRARMFRVNDGLPTEAAEILHDNEIIRGW
jgi:hypothetical protein